jgi:hypothetical protein
MYNFLQNDAEATQNITKKDWQDSSLNPSPDKKCSKSDSGAALFPTQRIFFWTSIRLRGTELQIYTINY